MATDILPPTPTLPPSPERERERPVDPDLSHVVTEDDTPVDNEFSDRQARLLVEPLYATWKRTAARGFVAMANVGLFRSPDLPPIVPDVLLSIDVALLSARNPAPGAGPKSQRSYFVWKYGKAPDVVIEVVSNREGGEASRKLQDYALIGVRYYAIFDPEHHVQPEDLRAFVLHGSGYVPLPQPWFDGVGLGLALWQGTYEDHPATWLRWTAGHDELIPTGEERAEALLAKLRARGIDPDRL